MRLNSLFVRIVISSSLTVCVAGMSYAQGSSAPPPQAPASSEHDLRLGGFFVGSFTYNSRIQMVPEFAGGAQALTPAGQTNFRFDKIGIGAFKYFTPWLSAHGALEIERHRDQHAHGYAPGFGCPGTAPCIERFGSEVPETEAVLDRFSVTARIPTGNGLYLSVGRVDVPFGIEKHDEPLNLTATTSELFQFGRAQRMTGAQATYNINPQFDVTGWWVNRWESETTHTPFDDNNSAKSYGGRLGYTPLTTDKFLNIGIGAFAGPERDNNTKDKRKLMDIDFVAAPSSVMFVAGEFAFGSEDNVSFRRRGSPYAQPAAVNEDVSWSSGYILVHGDANEWAGLNLRYGYISDSDGARTGVQQKLQSITLGPVFHLSAIGAAGSNTGAVYGRTRHPIHWADIKVEYRFNFSDQQVFSALGPGIDITDATKKNHQFQVQFVVNF